MKSTDFRWGSRILGCLFLVLIIGNQVLAHDELQVTLTVPDPVTPPTAFPLTITVTKPDYSLISFNRIAVAYAPNDNLSVIGPFEVWRGTPTWSGTPPRTTIAVNMQLLTARPSSSIIPLIVTLWENGYGKANFRGQGMVGVKIIK